MALVAYYVFKMLHNKCGNLVSRIISGIGAEIVMIVGYFIFAGFLYGFGPAVVNIPANAVQGEKRTYRTLSIDGEEFEFSEGFTELHTKSYKQILQGKGFRIAEARPCIEMVSQIRNAEPIGFVGDYHPLAKLPLAKHPFGWDERR